MIIWNAPTAEREKGYRAEEWLLDDSMCLGSIYVVNDPINNCCESCAEWVDLEQPIISITNLTASGYLMANELNVATFPVNLNLLFQF